MRKIYLLLISALSVLLACSGISAFAEACGALPGITAETELSGGGGLSFGQYTVAVYDGSGNILMLDQVGYGYELRLSVPDGEDGKIFKGWFTEPDGKGTQWENGSAVTGPLKLYEFFEDDPAYASLLKSLSIDGYDIDFSPEQLLYVCGRSAALSGLHISAQSFSGTAVHWGILSDNGCIWDEEPSDTRYFSPEELNSENELRILIKCGGSEQPNAAVYSILLPSGANETGLLPGDYTGIIKAAEVDGSSSLDTDTPSGLVLKLGIRKDNEGYPDIDTVSKDTQVYYFDMWLYDKNDIFIPQEGSLPIQVTLRSSLPYTMGKNYEIYRISSDCPEKQNIVFSSRDTVTFQTSGYGRFALCYTPDYSVTFMSDGEVYYQQDNISTSAVSLPEPPQRSGFRFLGWYTLPDGGGEKFDENSRIICNMTVYAYWQKISYALGPAPSAPAKTPKPEPSPSAEPLPTASAVIPAYDTIFVIQENGTIDIRINNGAVLFTDALPFIDANDRTQIPLRAVCEALGAEVLWDEAGRTVTITKDGISARLSIGSNIIYKNNSLISMDTEAMIVSDRTYIPVKYIGEIFGYEVSWDSTELPVSEK